MNKYPLLFIHSTVFIYSWNCDEVLISVTLTNLTTNVLHHTETCQLIHNANQLTGF